MTKPLALLLALSAASPSIGSSGAHAAAQQVDWEALEVELEDRIAQHRGRVGLVVLDPRTGESLSIRGEERFPTASTIKVPVLIELFHEVERGDISLDDPLIVTEGDQVGGSGVLQLFDTPLEITVRDAATFMIAHSDNTATNLVVRKLGIRAINERMDSLGYPATKLWAEVFRRDATSIAPDSSEAWGLGVTTPMEMAEMFAAMHRGEAVSPEASRQMIDMHREQFWGANEIPRWLPAGVVAAHKTGSVNASRSDCGIVYAPRPRGQDVHDPAGPGGRDYVLCVFTDANEDRSWRLDNEAEVLIGELSRIVWRRLGTG